MTTRAGTRLLALPPAAVVDRPEATLRDVAATLDPDAIWVLGPSRDPRAFARAGRAFEVPTVHPPLATGDGYLDRQQIGGGPEVAVVPRVDVLRADPESVSSTIREGAPAALVCDDVATDVRPTALEATLGHADALAAALPTGRETTLLTGAEPAGYDARWHLGADTGAVVAVDHDPAVEAAADPGDDRVGVRLRGVGPVDGYRDRTSVAVLSLSADGVERIDAHSATDFGLEAVSGVGPKTAARLADRGVATREVLLETPVETLASLPGVGPESAREMHHHARVIETGEPRRVTADPLPGAARTRPPLCLDIETDGLSPTIIWQVGVYDPAADEHRAFVEREEPDDPAPVLEAFCDWLLATHPDRALLTWNGWRFDYRHLGAFVARHVPYYAEEWESIPKLDLYGWAISDGNAVLPGRTNELDVVAQALDYEGAGTGLDGATTAAAYQRFRRTGTPLEWDRHEAYCEDDCRALWHVYERLREAPRAPSSRSAERRRGTMPDDASGRDDRGNATRTEQTDLGEF